MFDEIFMNLREALNANGFNLPYYEWDLNEKAKEAIEAYGRREIGCIDALELIQDAM
jgi:hypothetical protein